MIQFFQHYISPLSPARTKLAIHLYAQGVSGGLASVDDTCEPIGTLAVVIISNLLLRAQTDRSHMLSITCGSTCHASV
jgi:hypothetical protein